MSVAGVSNPSISYRLPLNIYYTQNINRKQKKKLKLTRSARMRALLGVPTPTAISFTPAESSLGLISFRAEASSQLQKKYKPK